MKRAWRAGDDKALMELGMGNMRRDFPGAYQSILVNRNRAWIDPIVRFLGTDEPELILVGALHLVGEHSVLEMLRQRGYKVTRFK